MSAECEIHGTDMYYTANWPEMGCTECDLEAMTAHVKKLEAALRQVLDTLNRMDLAPHTGAAIARNQLRCALTNQEPAETETT